MDIHSPLTQYFGYTSFRPGQEGLITAALHGSDVLGIMPTGGGKSICYQIPALLLPGLSLVISPLISLMQDQVTALRQLGYPAAYLNSSLSQGQQETVLYRASQGAYKLLYVTPERLSTPAFRSFAQSNHIAMVTVDEAHCISQWGQDFRPSYLEIPHFVSQLPQRPVVAAFTATATQRVQDDIVNQLELQSPHLLVTGFDRPNLYFQVARPDDKLDALLHFLRNRTHQCGIVYCATRKNVEEVCTQLRERDLTATRYHAGLTDEERRINQEDFLFDRATIMVATNAFGMGIDKSNVAFVVHYNMPKDLEAYYQEAGRAGRDGSPATCLLLYSPQDVRTAQWMIENGQDDPATDPQQVARQRAQEHHRLQLMTRYATTTQCLRAYILHYFGDTSAEDCQHCGNCDGDFTDYDATVEAQKLLSCVHRLRGRYAAGTVIQVLRGSKTRRILTQGLNELPTFGISRASAETLHNLIGHLLQLGYLKQTDDQYLMLTVTQAAAPLLRGQEKLTLRLPSDHIATAKSSSKPTAAPLPDHLQPLFQQLRELRTQVARLQGVPAYVVFSDSTLTDMCHKKPTTLAEFRTVSGVGDQKLSQYGQRFLDCIQHFQNTSSSAL